MEFVPDRVVVLRVGGEMDKETWIRKE